MLGEDRLENILCQIWLWINVNVSRVCSSRIRLEHIYLNAKVSQPFNICIFFSMVHVIILI